MRKRQANIIKTGSAALLLLVVPAASIAQSSSRTEQSVRGIVRAEATVRVSTQLVARISAMPFRRGESFRAGDALVTFDCARYAAELRAAEAEAKSNRIVVDTNQQLVRHRAAGTNDLEIAQAKLAQAEASLDALKALTAQCEIRAPFDGSVADRTADVFEIPQANAPLMTIVKDGTLELDLIVPSQWAVWLKPGYRLAFTIDETGTTHDAALLHLGATIDPVSRTMRVSARLLEASPAVRPGMSGTATLIPPNG